MRRRPPRSTLLPCTTLFRPRTPELAGAPAGQDLLAVDLQLGAEAAADLRRHDADLVLGQAQLDRQDDPRDVRDLGRAPRSEEHTYELQPRQYLVCRLLLAKK